MAPAAGPGKRNPTRRRLRQVLLTDTPPSASRALPVVKPEAAEARNSTDPAISSGVEVRLRACSPSTNAQAS